ncbi:MAG: hypothetical protein QM778_38970 [Myxococcales bacterium]
MIRDWSLELSDSQEQQLLGELEALRTTNKRWCTYDATDETLTVYDRTGAARQYESNIDWGCNENPPPGTMLIDYTYGPEGQFLRFLFSLRPAADGG